MRSLCAGTALATGVAAAPAQAIIANAQDEAQAETNRVRQFSIPPQPLDSALKKFSSDTGLRFAYRTHDVAGLQSTMVSGQLTPDQALARMLQGTGLVSRYMSQETVVVAQAANISTDATLGTINVQGAQVVEPAPEENAGPAAPRFGDAPPEPGGLQAEFQTTATKTPMSIRETPQAISVVTRDSLEVRQVQDLGQALETVAGVNQYSGTGPFGGTAPWGFDETQMRGIPLDGGYDIRDDGFVTSTYWSSPDIELYERIEAVKGPSSTLYGRSSAGGFINRVRKRPEGIPSTEVKTSIGSFDHYRGVLDTTGPINESGTVQGRFVGVFEDAGSFVDGVESQRQVLAPGISMEVTPTTRVTLLGSYQKDEFIPNSGFPLVLDNGIFRAPDRDRSTFFGRPNTSDNEWETLYGTVEVDQEIGDNWLATLRFNRVHQDTPIFLDSYAYNYGGLLPGGNLSLYSAAYDLEQNSWSGELRLNGDVSHLFNREAKVTFGTDRLKSTSYRAGATAANGIVSIYGDLASVDPVAPGAPAFMFENQSREEGYYAQFQIRPVERLNILMGTRYDWVESTSISAVSPTETRVEEAVTGRVGLTYDLTRNVTAYGLYGTSFTPSNAISRNGILDPETGEIYEAGLKTEWLGGKLGVNASIYRLYRDDVAIPDPTNMVGEAFSVAAGLQRSDGIELEVNGEIMPGWKVSFAGAWVNSEFLDPDDPFFGSRPAGTADWQYGAYTSYELQSGPLKGFGLGAGIFSIGERGVSAFAAGSELEGYTRGDLYAFYNGFEDIELTFQVRNIADATYVEGADRVGAYGQFGAPRTYLFAARKKF